MIKYISIAIFCTMTICCYSQQKQELIKQHIVENIILYTIHQKLNEIDNKAIEISTLKVSELTKLLLNNKSKCSYNTTLNKYDNVLHNYYLYSYYVDFPNIECDSFGYIALPTDFYHEVV